MSEELNRLDRGEDIKHDQWYEKDPKRLSEEVSLMKLRYPGFVLLGGNGEDIYWIGTAKCFSESGQLLYSLNIKVVCDRDYPVIYPKVIDLDKVISEKNCPHLDKNNDEVHSLCYGNRLDPELDFVGKIRIINLIDYIGIFLARQWHFERNGEWPDGQAHGCDAFLEYEAKSNIIPKNNLCPCGATTKRYGDCCLPKIEKALLDTELKNLYLQKVKIKVGRNNACPCGSNKKSKKCCYNFINYPRSRIFIALKYPDFFKRRVAESKRILGNIKPQ